MFRTFGGLHKFLRKIYKCKHPNSVQVIEGAFFCDKCRKEIIYDIPLFIENAYMKVAEIKIDSRDFFIELFMKLIDVKYKEYFNDTRFYDLAKNEQDFWTTGVLPSIAEKMYYATSGEVLEMVGTIKSDDYYFNILPTTKFYANLKKLNI